LASEPIAVALLDEGLFRRIGPEVTVKAELIHEYLLSRILPQDPFLDLRRFEELSDGYPLAYGAGVFRLCVEVSSFAADAAPLGIVPVDQPQALRPVDGKATSQAQSLVTAEPPGQQ
jgi:hypothetical protein